MHAQMHAVHLEHLHCPNRQLEHPLQAAFAGRTTANYYTSGKGSGLSFQELPGYAIGAKPVPLGVHIRTLLYGHSPSTAPAPQRVAHLSAITSYALC